MPVNALKKIVATNIDEVANVSLASGTALFGLALADLATYVTVIAGFLSVVGLSLGIYLKILEIAAQKRKDASHRK